jgi:hypothetical protein
MTTILAIFPNAAQRTVSRLGSVGMSLSIIELQLKKSSQYTKLSIQISNGF